MKRAKRTPQRSLLLWALGVILLALALCYPILIREKSPDLTNQSNREARRFINDSATNNHSKTTKTRKSNRNPSFQDYSERPEGMTGGKVLAQMRINPKLRPPYRAFDNDDHVTGQLESALSLTDEERNLVQGAFEQFKSEVKKLMVQNMSRLSELEIDGITQAYRIRPYELDDAIRHGGTADERGAGGCILAFDDGPHHFLGPWDQ